MAEQARIASTEALEAFRAALIVFISRTRQSLESAQDAVKKTRGWLQTEQPAYWAAQLKLRQKRLEQAQAELLSARMSEFVETPAAQQMAVRKARAAVEEAQAGMERTKAWAREFDRAVDPMTRKLDALRDYIENDLTQATAHLAEVQRLLQAYVETPAASPAAVAPSSVSPEPP